MLFACCLFLSFPSKIHVFSRNWCFIFSPIYIYVLLLARFCFFFLLIFFSTYCFCSAGTDVAALLPTTRGCPLHDDAEFKRVASFLSNFFSFFFCFLTVLMCFRWIEEEEEEEEEKEVGRADSYNREDA